MKSPRLHGIFSVCLILCLALAGSAQAQETNLLSNPDFEGAFTQYSGDQPRSVANGWTPWNVARDPAMPSFQNTAPKYLAAAAASAAGVTPRVRNGSNAQIYYSFFETHDGGIYQQISGITPGSELRFSVYAYVWSSTFADQNTSDDPGDVALRVGIDPSGGTDASASSVIYSTPLIAYDTFREYSVITTAQSSTVTVFIRSTVGLPVQSTYIYLDDAVLAPTTDSGSTSPSSTPPLPQASPTNTSAPTATRTLHPPTNTAQAPTATSAISQASPTNTNAPIAVAIDTAQAPTATSAISQASPTNTSTPIAVATDTAQAPTATSAISQTSPTNTPAAVVVVATDTPRPASSTPVPPSATPILPTATLPSLVVASDTPIPGPQEATPTREVAATLPSFTNTPPPNFSEFPGTLTHVVRSGDSIASLASLYGSSIAAILSANSLPANAQLSSGQILLIPVSIPNVVPPTRPAVLIATPTAVIPPIGSGVNTPAPPQPIPTNAPAIVAFEYTVQRGDSLWTIAQRFRTTTATLVQINGIANPNSLKPGQRLFVPASEDIGGPTPLPPAATPTPVVVVVTNTPAPAVVVVTNTPPPANPPTAIGTYIVRNGDSLYLIAVRFGVSIVDLGRLNNISNYNLIFVGQQLLIPGRR